LRPELVPNNKRKTRYNTRTNETDRTETERTPGKRKTERETVVRDIDIERAVG
jgi:hypothetical protein